MQIKGYVEKIIYTNSDNGHTILDVSLTSDEIKRLQAECPDYADDIDEEMVCVGTLHLINAGEYVVFNGDFTVHQTYGLQFKVTSYEESRPEDMDSIERYLGSGAIKGVGPALAARIVRHFKMDTFHVIEETPEELSQVKGISNRMAMEIADQVAEKKGMRNAMLFLGKLGIGMNLAVKIYKEYGEKVYEIIENNPYKLADDMEGVGFKIADEIARNSGMELDSPFRIKSGILYALSAAVSAGHTYYPMDALIEEAGRLLGVFIAKPEEILTDLMIDRKVMVRDVDGIKAVYLYSVYHTELAIAHRLFALKFEDMPDEKAFDKDLHSIEKEENITLESMQREAVRASAGSGIVVITGGPGTGKTTTINTIIRYFERKGMDIMLAAPTGRAAKRMTEATGHEAQTIHRMLELSGILSDEISNASLNAMKPIRLKRMWLL